MPLFILVLLSLFLCKDAVVGSALNTILSCVMGIGFLSFPILFIVLNFRHLKSGQTWGYKIMGLKLVSEDGKDIANQALARAFSKLIMTCLMVTYVVPAIHGVLVFGSKGEKDILDRAFGTKAVKA